MIIAAKVAHIMFAIVIFALMVTVKAEETWDFQLEHSLDGGQTFETRNSFRFVLLDAESGKQKVEFEPYPIFSDTVKKLESLSLSNGNYILRTNARPSSAQSAYITAHLSACSLLRSNLVENIIFHFDSKDRLISFEYANEVVDQSEEVCSATGNSFSKIKSRGVVDGIDTSKLPVAIDGNMFYNAAGAAQNPGAPSAGAAPGAAPGGKSAKPAEKSFFQKYWTWIVGGVVYFMYKSMTAELPNQPGAAGSGGAAGKK